MGAFAPLRAELLVLQPGLNFDHPGGSAMVWRFETATGTAISTFSYMNEGFYAMSATPDGGVFVTSNILGTYDLYQFTRAGAYRGTAASGNFADFNGVTRGADGNLFCLMRAASSSGFDAPKYIARLDRPGGSVFVANGTGGMAAPLWLISGPDRNLYAIDRDAGVLRFDGATGAALGVFVPPGRGGLATPTRMVFGPDGRLYVSTGAGSSVLRFDGANGAFIDTFVAPGSGGLSFAHGLAFGPDGNLCVASRDTHRVLRYSGTSGAFIDVFAAPANLRYPTDLAFTSGATRDEIWFDDAPPPGASVSGAGWNWVASAPAPISGTRALQVARATGPQTYSFNFASEPLALGTGDAIFVHVYVADPGARELMLSWCDGASWEHRAYWGADAINEGQGGTASRRYLGTMPKSGGWLRLEVPAAFVGLEGRSVQGLAITIVDGGAAFDQFGKAVATAAPTPTPDTTPPIVTITAPANGATVSGSVVIDASAKDDFATFVQRHYYIDGVEIPFGGVTWDTTKFINGAHTVRVTGTDTAGNVGSASVTVTVSNGTSSPPPAPAPTGAETIWFDDDVPAGATLGGSSDSWTWITASPAPRSGARAHQSSIAAGLHEHYFDWAYRSAFNVTSTDTLFTYVYLDPANRPREIMLSFRDANNWEHRAYWGEDLIGYGLNGTTSRQRLGDLPAAGSWVRLSIPASAVGLNATALYGMSFSAFDGRATWDAVGKVAGGTADTTPPTVTLTSPANGATVSGSVTVTGDAFDSGGTIASVRFAIDGVDTGLTEYNPPWSFSFSTSSMANGSHTIAMIATDAAGNRGSATITVTLANSGPPPPPPPSPTGPTDTIWFDDDLPAGAIAGASGGDAWNWVTANPAPVSGGRAHQSALASGLHDHFFGSAPPLHVDAGDTLVVYVYLDPAALPRELMLSWFAGNWEHRAYWGENLITYGSDRTASRQPMGALPAVGQWVRLEVPASSVGLGGSEVTGMSFTLFGGRATWDRIGKRGTGTTSGDSTPPTAAILAPAAGATLSGRVWVEMRFTDNLAVTRVLATVDGRQINASTWNQSTLGLTIPWETSAEANGSHTFTAQAWDAAGNTVVSTAVNVNVSNTTAPPAADTTPPTVTLTAPADNATVSGNAVVLSANASDNVGVASVAFRVDGATVATDSTAPFSVTWNSAAVANGSHALTAVAFDAAGNQATSAPAIVSVNNSTSPGAVIWIDGAIPAGAMTGSSGGDTWLWITSNPAPFAATRAHQSALAGGLHDHFFVGTTAPLQVFAGDTLFAYVYLDPANAPSEIMLSFNDGSWEHRAYWGANTITYGQDGTDSRRSMGALPAAGQWVKLEIPARLVGLEGRSVSGLSFTLVGGRATWDIAGKVSP